MNAMTIAHMAGVLTSAIQAADRLELDALKGPALADMDLDRIRDIKRDWNGDWWWLLDDGTAQRLTQIEIIEWQSDWKEES